MGVTHSTIGRWLSGKANLSREGLEKIGKAINAPPGEIRAYFNGNLPLSELFPSDGPIHSMWLVQSLQAIPHLTLDEVFEILREIAIHHKTHGFAKAALDRQSAYEILIKVLRVQQPTLQSLVVLDLDRRNWNIQEFAREISSTSGRVEQILQGDHLNTEEIDAIAKVLPAADARLLRRLHSLSQPEACKYKSLTQAVMRNWDLLTATKIPLERLKLFRDGGDRPTEVELLRLAIALNLSEDCLQSLPLKTGEGNGTQANGNSFD